MENPNILVPSRGCYRDRDFEKVTSPYGHGQEFVNEFVSETVLDSDKDSDKLKSTTSDSDTGSVTDKIKTSVSDSDASKPQSSYTISDLDSDSRVRRSLSLTFKSDGPIIF